MNTQRRALTTLAQSGLLCPVCLDKSSYSLPECECFCDEHYRQFLATFQVRPPTPEALTRVREAMLASGDTLPKGQDAKQGLAGTEGSAVAKPDAQTPSPSSRERK